MPPPPPPPPLTAAAPQIKQLPESVAVRLRSTLAITALPDAVSELVQNSLDAGARNVSVQVNLARNSCVVEDDGVGILPEDVGMVGKMYATSKYPFPDSAAAAAAAASDKPSTFGFRGQALSSLSTHSLFTLTSRHASHRSTHTTRFSYSTPLFTGPAPAHLRLPSAGTLVRIEGLHADLPVRFHARLQENFEREWDHISWRIAQLLLTPAARGVSITARDEHGARRVSVKDAQLPTGVLAQIYGRGVIGTDWERVRAVQGPVKIKGWVSRRGHGTRELQFLYVNGHPLPAGTTTLHAEVNRVFAASAFGVAEEGEGRRKAVERYAMFVLWVECEGGGSNVGVLGGEGGTEGKAGLEGGHLAAVVELLQKLLREFLKTNHFQPAPAGSRATKTARNELQKDAARSRSRPGTPLSTIKNGSFPENHGDSRALALWSRVKSAKADSKEEEGRKGTGFSAKEFVFHSPSPRTVEIHDNDDTPATPDSSKENDVQVLWSNPISKRSFHVNSRTGNTTAADAARKRPAIAMSSLRSIPPSNNSSMFKKARVGGDKGPFVEELLKNWKNPVFAHTEAPIPSLTTGAQLPTTTSCAYDCHDGFLEATSTTLGKLTKPGLQSAQVIAQVDHKYILIKMRGLLSAPAPTPTTEKAPELLVIIDQHAADERVRVEALFANLASSAKPLQTPLIYALSGRDAALLRLYDTAFNDWGIQYHIRDTSSATAPSLHVTALPAAVADRCVAEPSLAIDMLRRHAYELSERPGGAAPAPWALGMAGCPRMLVEMVNSRACRGAVMFNDVLQRDECVRLVQRLAECRFPFMCAHGRPSMVPLVDLGGGVGEMQGGDDGGGFKRDFKRWMERNEEEEAER